VLGAGAAFRVARDEVAAAMLADGGAILQMLLL